MKSKLKHMVARLPLLFVAGGLVLGATTGSVAIFSSGEAFAQESQQRQTRRVVAMSNKVLTKIQEVNALINPADEDGKPIPNFKPNYAAALKILDEVRGWKDLNSADLTQLWNFYAYVYMSQDDYPKALQAYEQITKIPDADPRFVTSILYNMAQLYMATEQYKQAISTLDRWFKTAESPNPDAYILYGQAYYMLDDFKRALPHLEKAVAVAKERNIEPKETWYQLLRHVYYENGNKKKSLEMVELLLRNWPKKIYWLQLAQMHAEFNNELKQLAAMEAAYRNGYLTQSRELENLAQLYLYHGTPYKAAKVMQEGLEKKVVENKQENWELLSTGWLNAQEYDKAVGPLTRAAEMAKEGELYLRLARVYSQMDDYENTVKATQTAIRLGGLRRADDAYVLKGLAEFELNRLADAKNSFRQAAKSKNSEQMAKSWIEFIENEETRREEIRKFLGS